MLPNVVALFCFAVCAAAADGARYYGYGSGIKGLPLFYSDGVSTSIFWFELLLTTDRNRLHRQLASAKCQRGE